MQLKRTKRIPAGERKADRKVLIGIRGLNGYKPLDSDLSVAELNDLDATVEQARQEVDRLVKELASARATSVNAEWALHDALRRAKSQVVAQYGEDSRAVEAVGRKRRSEYRRPARTRSEPQREEADLVTQ